MVESISYLDRKRADDERELKCCGVFLLLLMIPLVWIICRKPKTHDHELRIDSVFTSAFNLTDHDFSGEWNVGFTVTVPNGKRKSTVSFDNVVCSVGYYNLLLGVKYQKVALVLGAGNHTAVNASVVAESAFIDEWTWVHMTAERSRGSVRFVVVFDAYGGVDDIDSACFVCPDLVVNFGSTNTNSGVGELVGGSRKCDPRWCPDQTPLHPHRPLHRTSPSHHG